MIAFPKLRPIAIQKAPGDQWWRALHQIADNLEPDVRNAFLRAVRMVQAKLDIVNLEDAVNRGTVDQSAFWQALQSELDSALRAPLREALLGGASVADRRLPSGTMRFDLTNPAAVRAVDTEVANLVREITNESRQAIRALVQQSMLGSFDVHQLARQIRSSIGLTSRYAVAVDNYQQTLLDNGMPDGQAMTRSQAYADRLLRYRAQMIARTECLVGDAPITAAHITAVFRRQYVGNVVEIGTSKGRKITITPNHPMLTHRGWLGAANLAKGDYLICHSLLKDFGAARYQHIETPPATVAEIFDSLSTVAVSEWKRTGQPDFHGDGSESQVHVLSPDRTLTVGSFAPLYEPLIKRILSPSDWARSGFCQRCSRLLSINQSVCLCESPPDYTSFIQAAYNGATVGLVFPAEFAKRRAELVFNSDLSVWELATVGANSAALEEILSSGGSASADADPFNQVEYPFGRPSHLFGYESGGETGLVELDRIVSVGLTGFRGHVYNLETPYGYFVANGIYTGNTIRATSAGQQAVWNDAQVEGLLPVDAQRVFITTPDDRLCEICAPMDGQTVGINEPFQSDLGPIDYPPVHVQCRCAVGIATGES